MLVLWVGEVRCRDVGICGVGYGLCCCVCAWWSFAGHPGSPGVLGQWRGEVLFFVRSLDRCSGSVGVLLDVWGTGPAPSVMPGYVLGVAR